MAPRYDLRNIKKYVRQDLYQVTGSAFRDAASLGFGREDIQECVLGLVAADFDKSDPSIEKPGLHLDIYKTSYCERELYVKLQVVDNVRPVVVVSFKRK